LRILFFELFLKLLDYSSAVNDTSSQMLWLFLTTRQEDQEQSAVVYKVALLRMLIAGLLA
jgi:hypothetical protein